MIILKIFLLLSVFGTISMIGFKLAGGYKIRVKNLRKIKKGLKILETKIVYTQGELPDLFIDISKKIDGECR